MKVLVVGPDRNDLGGVSNYYNAVFPRLSDDTVSMYYLEVGSTRGGVPFVHVILDQIRFWRTLVRVEPDIVHLNPSLVFRGFLRDGVLIWIAKKNDTRVLVFFRGWRDSFEKEVSGRLRWFFDLTYSRADEFIVLANKFSDRLRDWGVSAPIHLGTTAVPDELLEGFSIDEKVSGIEKEGPVRVLYLSRLERKKGILELIDAVEWLLESGVHLTLTIAGDGPIMSQVNRRAAKLNRYRDSVQIVGYVRGNRKKEILKSHHLFCFPSEFGEGMPNAVLEAMAFGMPIITCPVGGIADFFEDNKMGKLIERNARHISEAIGSLVPNRRKITQIARYNHEYARSNFLASTAAAMLRKRYQKIFGDGMDLT